MWKDSILLTHHFPIYVEAHSCDLYP
jgi:hypothetical protein